MKVVIATPFAASHVDPMLGAPMPVADEVVAFTRSAFRSGINSIIAAFPATPASADQDVLDPFSTFFELKIPTEGLSLFRVIKERLFVDHMPVKQESWP